MRLYSADRGFNWFESVYGISRAYLMSTNYLGVRTYVRMDQHHPRFLHYWGS